MKKQPSIGDAVNFVLPAGHSKAGTTVPAKVTHVTGENVIAVSPGEKVHDDRQQAANLCSAVPFSESPKPGTWHWPKEAAAAPAKA